MVPMERQSTRRIAATTSTHEYDDLMEKYTLLQQEFETKRKAKVQVQVVQEIPNPQLTKDVNYVDQRNFQSNHQGYQGNQ